MLSIMRQRGFSIPMAVFVMLVLAMLGVALTRIVERGQLSVAREVVSIRALMAAESGAERGLQHVLYVDGSVCGSGLPTFSNILGVGMSWDFSGPGLAGCSATISCSRTLADSNQDGLSTSHYTIRSVGRCGPAGSQAVRIIEVQAR